MGDGTNLVELRIRHVKYAHDIVGRRFQEGDSKFLPVVLDPAESFPSCCCVPLCFVSIPEGFGAIVSKFGAAIDGDKEDGTWSSGFHWLSPFSEVHRLVTKQLVVFDAPVKDVRTSDRIPVSIDVLVAFQITQAKEFVFNLGPEKFDDLLRAAQDEAIREIANETPVDSVQNIHGLSTQHIIDSMNEKFDRYGVTVRSFTVKSVTIPEDLATDYEDRTLLDPQTTQKHMEQQASRQKLQADEDKVRIRDECANIKMAAEQQAEVVRSKAVKDTSGTIAENEKQIAELETTKNNEVRQLQASQELENTKLESQLLVAEREIKSKTKADIQRIAAETEAYTKEKEASGKVQVAEKLAEGMKALGDAEGVSSTAFAARRAHEAEMRRLDIVHEIVRKEGAKIATTQENSVGLNEDNAIVTAVAHQGLEALRAKMAEMTAVSIAKLEAARPAQYHMVPTSPR